MQNNKSNHVNIIVQCHEIIFSPLSYYNIFILLPDDRRNRLFICKEKLDRECTNSNTKLIYIHTQINN